MKVLPEQWQSSGVEIMNDLISRQEAIDEIMSLIEEPEDDFNEGVRTSASVIYKLPSAQPQCKGGKWEKENWFCNSTIYKYTCSECGAHHRAMYDYCPSCGADMRGEQDE